MAPLLFFLLCFLSLVLLFLLLVYAVLIHRPLRDHLHFKAQGISCAPFIPVFGHLSGLFQYEAEDRNLDYWRDHVRTYGPIHAISLGASTSIKLDDPRYLKDVLRTQNHHYVPSLIQRMYLDKHLGEHNLLLTSGSEHARHRRTIAPAFMHSSLVDMVQLMARETEATLDAWTRGLQANESVTLDLHEKVTELTFAIIAACAFGSAFAALPDAPASLHSTMRWIAEQTQWRAVHFVGVLPLIRDLPFWGKAEMDRKKASMFALVDAVVRDRKAGKTSSATEGKMDLLDLLLSASDPQTGAKLSDTEVRDEAMTLVLAGHETTSSLMCWALYALISRPHLWAECLEQVELVCGADPPLPEHLSQLPLLDAVIHETLRLFPSAPIISKDVVTAHSITADDPALGLPPIHLCPGQEIHIDFHMLHRLPEYWGPHADDFDHTRWMQTKKPYSHPYAYAPFSSGTRNCIGQNFARSAAAPHTPPHPLLPEPSPAPLLTLYLPSHVCRMETKVEFPPSHIP